MAMPVSTELKKYMEKICDQARAVNPRWAEVFHECFLNTLETTIERLEDGSTFVVTGDIPAMWLRDSTAQGHLRHDCRFSRAPIWLYLN